MHGQGLLRQHQSKLDAIYRISDTLLICGTLLISTMLAGAEFATPYWVAMLLATTVFAITGEAHSVYRSYRGASVTQQAIPILVAWGLTVFFLLVLGVFLGAAGSFSRPVIITWMLATPIAVIAWRIAIKYVLSMLRTAGYNSRRVAIIGAEKNGAELGSILENSPAYGLKLVGFFDDRHNNPDRVSASIPSEQLRGSINDAIVLARNGDVDLIYIALSSTGRDRALRIINELADSAVAVHVVPDLFVFDLLHSQLINIGRIPTLSVYESPYFGTSGWLKRSEDIVLSLIILSICAIPMLAIAIGVKLSSPGPVIFKQRRYGVDGKEIRVWKFRSMTTCDDGDKVVQATKGDARVTPLGAFLRKTSLDELPQFINVLKGDMSVVGPRPHAVAHNEHYRRIISGYMLRHKVKPGITGWAQVNGWRGETDSPDKMSRRVEHDIDYIRSWSLWLDLKIVVRTMLVGFNDKSAY
ncbi:undecaprenyl-phosphate glucose phosphotransferase [Thiosocius teredinicola]|uniref:undecaprenyl-phosphate glucose phosphotransferase n=1 Tax=Thiosocius teredinicola TaxID=1973002 RepID=UPI000990A5FF